MTSQRVQPIHPYPRRVLGVSQQPPLPGVCVPGGMDSPRALSSPSLCTVAMAMRDEGSLAPWRSSAWPQLKYSELTTREPPPCSVPSAVPRPWLVLRDAALSPALWGVPKPGPDQSQHHQAGPVTPKHHQPPPHILCQRAEASPTSKQKKVIKRKGRSYLFFCYATPELPSSEIKSWSV